MQLSCSPRYPPNWNNSALGSIFGIATASSKVPNAPTTHHSNAGAIAGGVVGGFLGLVLILTLYKYFLTQRLHRKPNALDSRYQAPTQPDSRMVMYWEPYEMESGREAWELDASNGAPANSQQRPHWSIWNILRTRQCH
jgi:hypothetical protein